MIGLWWVGKAVEESGRGLFWSAVHLLRWKNRGLQLKTLVTIPTGFKFEPRNFITGSATAEHFTATYIGSVYQWVFSTSPNTKLHWNLMSEKQHSDIFIASPPPPPPPLPIKWIFAKIFPHLNHVQRRRRDTDCGVCSWPWQWFVVSKRYIGLKYTCVLCVWDNTVIFCSVLRGLNRTPYVMQWQRETRAWEGIDMYSPDRRCECYGTLPTPCRSTALSWVRYFTWIPSLSPCRLLALRRYLSEQVRETGTGYVVLWSASRSFGPRVGHWKWFVYYLCFYCLESDSCR
jgi:hypothetical protein